MSRQIATTSKTAIATENHATALPAADTHIQSKADALKSRWRRAGMADNTVTALASSTRLFNAWCADRDIQPTGAEPTPYYPAAPETVALFAHEVAFAEWTPLRDPAQGGRQARADGMKPATVARHVSMIAKAHRLADYPSPSAASVVADALKAIRRTKRTRQTQAAPINRDRLGVILDTLAIEPADERAADTLRRYRDAALLALAFSACLRESEIVALTIENIVFETDGTGVVEVEFSKTDQEGEGDTRFLSRLAVRHLRAWIDAAGIESGPLFFAVRTAKPLKDGTAAKAIAPREIGRIMARRAAEAGIQDTAEFSGHSCRVGASQTAAANGASVVAIQRMGGWKSARMPAHYTRRQSVRESAAAQIAAAYGD